MKLTDFLRDKSIYFIIHLFVMIFITMFLAVLKLGAYAIFFAVGIYFVSAASVLAIEYLTKVHFYRTVREDLDALDRKSLLCEMIERPDFFEGRFLYDVLMETGKSQNDEIAASRIAMANYREYIELWMHEVKTPLAAARLTIENNKSDITRSIGEDLDKMEQLLEQALYYSRSESVEKDYIIHLTTLDHLVNASLRKNARAFISHGVQVETRSLDFSVYTDAKWIDFILTQLFINAVKYRSAHAKVTVSAQRGDNCTILTVADNGIGIDAQDLPRVFEKGFTGNTGRRYSKSTGIGLYLCKKLCDILGMGIRIDSVPDKGTQVHLVFPEGEMTGELTKV